MGAYYRYFAPLRDQPIRILEIGASRGGSLKTWLEFFTRAEIFAVDINPACKALESSRVRVFIGDQADTAFLESVADAAGGWFDIIIDDGGHFVHQQITSFNALFSHVVPGGIYVIEDLHTSYSRGFGGGPGKTDTTVEFLKGMVDIVNRHGRKGRGSSPEAWRQADRAEAESPAKEIESIEFCRSISFVVKKPSSLSPRRTQAVSNAGSGISRQVTEPSAPKVSIVLACCDAERFLSECLESIIHQTLPEWELHVLDDGSKDGTRQIIEEYARRDPRIKPYYFDDNRGPYIRRNLAIAHARSDFIVIQDADDLMCPNKLERLYHTIAADERFGIVGSCYRMFLDGYPGEEYTEEVTLTLEHEEIVKAFGTEGTWDFCWHGSAIMRKQLFQEIGP
jgi:SAM-dependent methyltransferase